MYEHFSYYVKSAFCAWHFKWNSLCETIHVSLCYFRNPQMSIQNLLLNQSFILCWWCVVNCFILSYCLLVCMWKSRIDKHRSSGVLNCGTVYDKMLQWTSKVNHLNGQSKGLPCHSHFHPAKFPLMFTKRLHSTVAAALFLQLIEKQSKCVCVFVFFFVSGQTSFSSICSSVASFCELSRRGKIHTKSQFDQFNMMGISLGACTNQRRMVTG